MENLVNILQINKYKHFSTGIYKDGNFFDMPPHIKPNAIKVQIKKVFAKKY